jgi:hypothetical protein
MGYMERLLHSLRYVYGRFNFGNFLLAWHLRNQIASDVFCVVSRTAKRELLLRDAV